MSSTSGAKASSRRPMPSTHSRPPGLVAGEIIESDPRMGVDDRSGVSLRWR